MPFCPDGVRFSETTPELSDVNDVEETRGLVGRLDVFPPDLPSGHRAASWS